jgi:hypothetical protein
MAKIENRADLIAGRYDGLNVGPGLVYSFETQEGLPVDNTNPLLRELSPFTIRIVPPSIVEATPDVNINLIGRAGQSVSDNRAAANAVRSLFGVSSVSGDGRVRLETLQRIVAAGQITTSASSLTERAVLVDVTTAADIAFQIEQILQTSPLTLLINPSDMSINYATISNYSERGRYGFIYEKWGESQPTISFSGSTGAFVAAASPGSGQGPFDQNSSSVSGVQYASKRDSAAWQNFMSLYHFYRNNGYIYDTISPVSGRAGGRGSEAHLMIGALAIDYDQWTYVGHIESFDYSYQEGMQHRIEWSMEFVVDQMYDLAQAPVSIQPLVAPQPNPSWPIRSSQSFLSRPDASGGGLFQASGTEQFAESPLQLLLPSQITSR